MPEGFYVVCISLEKSLTNNIMYKATLTSNQNTYQHKTFYGITKKGRVSQKWDVNAILYWYHCIVSGLNRRVERVLNVNVTWFCFYFDFVHSHTWCGCCSIVCLRFQVVQIKQVVSKIRTKMWIIINKKLRDIFRQLLTQEYKATKK